MQDVKDECKGKINKQIDASNNKDEVENRKK